MLKNRTLLFRVALALALLSAAAAAIAIQGLLRSRAEQAARLGKVETDNRELRARAENLAHELESLRQSIPSQPAPSEPASAQERKPGVDALEQAKMLIQFRDKLATANRSIDSLQARIQELEYTVEKTSEENKRLAASEGDLKEKQAATSRVLEAVSAELKGKDDRMTELEAASRRLREENRASAEKLAQLPKTLRDLEEINRRREQYLNTILRRYRDVTDQYRALAARLENSASGAELAGIQNAIAMTEEDLRQLATLNAQATRIQQKLASR